MTKFFQKILLLGAVAQPLILTAKPFDPNQDSVQTQETEKPTLKFGLKPSLILGSTMGSVLNHGGSIEKNIGDNISVGGRIDFWTAGSSFLNVSDLSLGAFAKYTVSLPGSKLRPYFSAGLANHILSVSSMYGSASNSSIGLDLGAGCGYEFGSGWGIDGGVDIRQPSEMVYTQIGVGVTKAI